MIPTAEKACPEKRKIKNGVILTILYSIIYAGFVTVSVFRPEWMGINTVLGLNLAVAYGLGLIGVAVLLAVIYNYLCRVPREETIPAIEAKPESDQ